MYKLCKTEQSAQRQRRLENGLLRMMTSRRYEEITVSDLCENLQIPRKSFYRYFSSKDGALYALIDHTLMEYEGFAIPFNNRSGRTLKSDMLRYFLFWVEHKSLLDALERGGMSGVLVERAVSHSLSESVMPKRFLQGDSLEICRQVTMFAVCGLMSMVLTWHHDGFQQSAEWMADIACRLLGKPLFPGAEALF